MDRLVVTGSYIHCFYYSTDAFPKLLYRRKLVTSTTWGSETEIDNQVVIKEETFKINAIRTLGDTLHVIWVDSPFGLKYIKKYSTSDTWSTIFDVSAGGSQFRDWSITNASNDIFFIWTWQQINYQYRQYDALPLAPQNLAISVYTIPDAQYPLLSWSWNNEPDVKSNDDGYLVERRTRIAGGSWGSWSQIGYVSGSIASYIDYGIGTAGDGFNDAEYRIRAKDVGNNISSYSSTVQIDWGHQGMEKKGLSVKPTEYLLEQNFPNPFNPTTKISYQIPLASHVSLKVFDILGNEVATLVNELKPEGIYLVEFNAENLPSGVYIYRLHAGKFTSLNKMVLMR